MNRLSSGSLDLIIDNETLSEDVYARYPLFTDQVLLAVPKALLPSASSLPVPFTARISGKTAIKGRRPPGFP